MRMPRSAASKADAGSRPDRPVVVARLVALFAAGWLAFNFPLLALWDVGTRWLGIPLLPLGLFSLWLLLIGVLGWLVEGPGKDDREP